MLTIRTSKWKPNLAKRFSTLYKPYRLGLLFSLLHTGKRRTFTICGKVKVGRIFWISLTASRSLGQNWKTQDNFSWAKKAERSWRTFIELWKVCEDSWCNFVCSCRRKSFRRNQFQRGFVSSRDYGRFALSRFEVDSDQTKNGLVRWSKEGSKIKFGVLTLGHPSPDGEFLAIIFQSLKKQRLWPSSISRTLYASS